MVCKKKPAENGRNPEADERRSKTINPFTEFGDDLPLAYQSLDPEGQLLEINEKWSSLLGYSRKDVLGHWFGEFLAPESRKRFEKRFAQFMDEGTARNVEFDMIRSDQTPFVALFNGRAEYNEDGTFERTHCIISDITERRLAEAELAASEARLRALLESNPDYILELDKDLKIQFANRASPGLRVEDLIGTYVYEHAEPGREDEIKKILETVLESGEPAAYETVFHTPGDATIYYESRAVARVMADTDETIGIILSVQWAFI